MTNTSAWAQHLIASPTLAIKALAEQLRNSGKAIYDFGIGEMNPEVQIPAVLKTGIIDALQEDATHYSPAAGDQDLRSAISDDLGYFQQPYSPEQIAICPGPKDAFFKACLAILNPQARRHRLLAFAPVYEAYYNIPQLLTGKAPILLPTDEQMYPEPDRLSRELAADDSIAVVVINSPNNPSGAVYPAKLLQEIAEVVSKYPDIWILSDDVYRTIIYNAIDYQSIATYLPEQTLLIGGASKEASGTGLRLGFVAGPDGAVDTIANINGNTSSCVNLPTQKGYARFLRSDSNFQERSRIRDQLARRQLRLLETFKTAAPEAKWHPPEGAFYFYPNMEAYLGRKTPQGERLDSDESLATYLLYQAGVVTIPGSKFFRSGHLRFAYAVSENVIVAGMKSLAAALATLR